MVVFKNNVETIEEQWWRILISSAGFYFVGLSYSHKNCSRDIFWCSLASTVLVFVYQLFKIRSGVVLEEDNMYVAYNLLPSAMYLIYYASIKLRKKYWLVAIASALTMFVYGTRGPILCIIVYLALYLVHRFSKTTSKRKFALILIGLFALAIVLVYDDLFVKLASLISNIFERFGFSTRIFDFYVSGDVAVSKGRDYLTNHVLEAIAKNPFIGYGFTGDQYLLGVYCHNLIYEMWCHFGVILGSLFLLSLAGLTVVALLKSRSNKKIFFFVVMLISMIYVKLMLSGTYTMEPYFYFMLGIFVAVNRKFYKTRRVKSADEEVG
ncbi:MAG: O-antigen ligase family protein [Clostridia bacterium]|nr:O-antigen ligase family protein [Clostridia bacterium]